jgi:hypothetical protein
MTGLQPHDDGWTGYAEALGMLHSARDTAYRTHLAARQAEAERKAQVSHLAARLGEQQRALASLAAQLKAPLSATALAPSAVPPLSRPTAVADLRARVDAADAALVEARRVARLPQLLPEWDSRFARAAVVYAGFATPNLFLTILLSLANRLSLIESEGKGVFLWFAVVWPAVTAFGGGFVVSRVAQSRLERKTSSPAGNPTNGTGGIPMSQQIPLISQLLSPNRRYRWFGVLLALACWWLPGMIIDPGHSGVSL